MKKFLAIAMALTVLATAVSAHVDGGTLGDVPTTSEEITVDGVKDDIYDFGLKVDVVHPNGTSEVKGTVAAYLLYKDGNLYVFGEVTDSDVVAPAEADQQSQPWVTDSFEVFINENNSDASTDSMQYRIDNAGWPCAYDQNGVAAYGADAASEYFSFGNQTTATGYNVEFCIPVTNTTVGVNFQLNDVFSDGSAQTWAMPYSEVTGSGTESWAAEKYPYITIGGSTVSLPVEEVVADEPAADAPVAAEATTTAPAAQTFDVVTIALALAGVSAAGIVVSKKRK